MKFFETMTIGTAIVLIILLVIVFLIVRGMVRKRKQGKSLSGCCGDCTKCSGCH